MDIHWKSGELHYCSLLIGSRGNENVGRDPKTVASYLRLQASSAFRDGEIEIAARLGEAATAINHDARNNHAPNWKRAEQAMLCDFPITLIGDKGHADAQRKTVDRLLRR